jgi:hypothetical protein
VFCPDATGNPRARYCSRECRAQARARRRRRRRLCQVQRKEAYPDQAAAEKAARKMPFPAEAHQCIGHWHIALADRTARYERRDERRRAAEQIAAQPAYAGGGRWKAAPGRPGPAAPLSLRGRAGRRTRPSRPEAPPYQ